MTPLVLLPGMMCDARLFGAQIGALSARWPVMTHPIGFAASMEGLAEQVLARAPQRFALAGLSMGGIVAMEILRQAPGRVERVALMDTNPLAEPPEVAARRPAQVARALAGELADVMRDEMKPNYLAESNTALLDLCLDMALALGPQVFARQSQALATRPDQTATLAAFRGPALVLMGAEDRLCPRDRHDLMHRLMPQSRLAIVPGAGHLPPLEQPHATTAELIRWLEE
ncbi:MAG: alpha/beta fold hydrolase [Paracoccaceae bacterium]|nr:MAG: alpha/beta fold hydrolase [Paracoccaceae bacterium]